MASRGEERAAQEAFISFFRERRRAMFRAWFSSRTTRSPERDRFFRPRLEYLEGRLAPSSMGMQGNDNGDDNNNNQGQNQQDYINRFDDFDTNTDDAFQIVLNDASVNLFFAVEGMAQTQLQQTLVSSLIQAVQTTSQATIQDAFTLVSDEFQLARDTGMLVNGIQTGASNQTQQALVQDIHNLQKAIQTNPLESSVGGQVAGALTFDVGLRLSLTQLNGQASASASASVSPMPSIKM
jgi:hypothetical protein